MENHRKKAFDFFNRDFYNENGKQERKKI